MLCADGPVRSLVELSLVGEHRRSHGGLCAALARGRVDADAVRRALAAVPLPRAADGRLVLAVDVTCWLRPDAHTSPQRIMCHTHGRGKDQHIPVPGWPYSVICALEPGRGSWTVPLDARRLEPGDDGAAVTAMRLRELLQRLIAAGQWRAGDPDVLVVTDAGYDIPRLAYLLSDLPVATVLIGRVREFPEGLSFRVTFPAARSAAHRCTAEAQRAPQSKVRSYTCRRTATMSISTSLRSNVDPTVVRTG